MDRIVYSVGYIIVSLTSKGGFRLSHTVLLILCYFSPSMSNFRTQTVIEGDIVTRSMNLKRLRVNRINF